MIRDHVTSANHEKPNKSEPRGVTRKILVEGVQNELRLKRQEMYVMTKAKDTTIMKLEEVKFSRH